MTPLEYACWKRIRELEAYALEKHGLHLSCGIEQEFFLRNAEGNGLTQDQIHDFEEEYVQEYDPLPKDMPTRWIDPSGLIRERLYQKYEMIVQTPYTSDHKREIFDGKYPEPAAPAMIARATDAARKSVKRYVNHKIDNAHAHFWPQDSIRADCTASMQVNLSAWSEGQPAWTKEQIKEIAEQSIPMMETMFPLMVESKSALDRHLNARHGAKYVSSVFNAGQTGFRTALRARHNRLEFRTPGADANSYLTILASTIALLDGIERREHGSEIPAQDHPIPATEKEYAQSVERFSESVEAERWLGKDLHKRLSLRSHALNFSSQGEALSM